MSRDNVEIVSAFVEAAGRDPKQGSSYLADDLEFAPFRHLDGPARGPAGFMSRVEEISSQFETYTVRAERLEQAGELVVADLRREATTTRGPAVIEDRFAQVFTLRDGKIVRVDSFSTFDEALEAAALREKATSHENVDVVRAAIDAYNQTGELPWELIDPEVEWVIDPSGNLAGPYYGHDGVRLYLKQLHDALDRLRLEIDEVVDAGDFVVALGRMRVRGKRSGATVEQEMALLCRVRRGRIQMLRTYIRPADALEAAGLRR